MVFPATNPEQKYSYQPQGVPSVCAGISDQLATCSQIADIQRPLYFDEPPTPSSQLAYQLLWNDPNSTDAVYGSHASSRGSDIQTFSAQQVETFCEVRGGHPAHGACALPLQAVVLG